MSKIEDLDIQPKYDNALQVQRTANIPDDEKYTAKEWNALISKTNEVVGRANLNTWSIVTNYSELPTDPVNGQKVYVTGTGLTGHVGVQMMVNGKSSRGFYVYDAFSDLWVQKTSEDGGGELKKIGDGYGLQHQIDNPDNYGTLGQNAVNLSYSEDEGDYGATGDASHAEGFETTASGYASHAEGEGTIASGVVSHAEGVGTTASGHTSHAEGDNTTASGDRSHAEGDNTTASGDRSHAEGDNTTASGDASHAEGHNTTAGSYAESARGLFNEIITPISVNTFNANDVIESVGVGADSSNRKNALTRWKNGAWKWLLQPLTNITNAVLGFHAADENGRLNYHNGAEWKKYLIDGEVEQPATPFIFTPTTDFTLSEIKTALEADGWKWNDSRILIDLGTNNFTCNIDVTTPTMITVERNGTGSISFIGTNVSYGLEGVSILTNSQISMALIKIISGTTKMIRISNKT